MADVVVSNKRTQSEGESAGRFGKSTRRRAVCRIGGPVSGRAGQPFDHPDTPTLEVRLSQPAVVRLPCVLLPVNAGDLSLAANTASRVLFCDGSCLTTVE